MVQTTHLLPCFPECVNDPDPECSPEGAPVSTSRPERAAVSASDLGRGSDPESIPERALVPEFDQERASVSKLSPKQTPQPKFGLETDLGPVFSPRNYNNYFTFIHTSPAIVCGNCWAAPYIFVHKTTLIFGSLVC